MYELFSNTARRAFSGDPAGRPPVLPLLTKVAFSSYYKGRECGCSCGWE